MQLILYHFVVLLHFNHSMQTEHKYYNRHADTTSWQTDEKCKFKCAVTDQQSKAKQGKAKQSKAKQSILLETIGNLLGRVNDQYNSSHLHIGLAVARSWRRRVAGRPISAV